MPSAPAQLSPFTPETGRIAGIKSAKSRNDLYQNASHYKKLAESLSCLVESAKSLNNENVSVEVQRQIALSEEQLARTRARLNAKGKHWVKDKERAALLRELRGLMEHLCRLRGIGEPARVRPSNEVNVSRRTVPRQLPPAVVQAEPVPTPPVDNTPTS